MVTTSEKKKKVSLMDNEVLLNKALELLNQVDFKEIEMVSVETNKFDDGSSSLNIDICYPAKE